MAAKVNLGTWREHWIALPVLALAAVLLLTALGREHLWADEGDTAVFARNILTAGVPTAWDGVSFIDSDFGERLTENFVMVSGPWLQYYVAAASFAALGDTAFAARLPFALCALGTIALVYLLLVRASGSRWTALSGAVLLTLSVQFLIYGRQSRYYALSAALTCLLVWVFLRMRSWRSALAFALVAALVVHSHPFGLAPVAALGALALAYPPFRPQRRWLWLAVPVVAVLTLPWLALARSGYEANTLLLPAAGRFAPRVLQYLVECASVTPVVGAAALAAFVTARRQIARRRARALPAEVAAAWAFSAGERALIVTLVSIIAAFAAVIAVTQSRDSIWVTGVRYSAAVIPFMAMITAILIARASRGRRVAWIALMLVLGFTKLGRLTPWTVWAEPTASREQTAIVTFHYPERLADRVIRTGQFYFIQDLAKPNPGTTARIVEFLDAHAREGDVVITNYGWEPLYFHTRLPLGMTVLPAHPIYAAVRTRGLPEYVSSDEGARWIVWRRAWGDYSGLAVEEVVYNLQAAGVTVTLEETIPETLWENRENVHFRRFAGGRYIYPWFESVGETRIYRLDWPDPKRPSVPRS